jgi:hypothetical protein
MQDLKDPKEESNPFTIPEWKKEQITKGQETGMRTTLSIRD